MNCPICGHNKQRFLVEHIGEVNHNFVSVSDTTDIKLIACAKCNLTLWTGEWRDWSDSHLYWDEQFQRLEMRSQQRAPKQTAIDTLVSKINALPKDVIEALLAEATKKEE